MFGNRLGVGVLVAGFLGIAACAPQPAALEGYRAISDADGLLVLDAAGFKGVEPKRVTHVEPYQRQEYALFENPGGRAEIVLVRARHYYLDNVSLNFSLITSDVIGLWNAFKGKRLEVGEASRLGAGWTTFWMRPFKNSTDDQACMAFTADWDVHGEDELLRPDQALFGYYCAAPGRALAETAAEAIIDGIGVRGVNRRFRGKNPQLAMAPAAQQEPLARMARDGATGTASFPFNMAEGYSLHGEGCSGNDC